MSAPAFTERCVMVNGHPCRIQEKGEGEPIGFLSASPSHLNWSPFMDHLAERRRVIVPSLPGFPGSRGHNVLDSHLEWLLATQELLRAAGLEGADIVAGSVAGALVADLAALWPQSVRKLVLVAPFGLYDINDPTADIWAQKPGAAPALFCADPAAFEHQSRKPDEALPDIEWVIIQTRGMEAAARFLWPLGDTRLAKRLPRVTASTLLVWGDQDKVMPRSYAERFATKLGGRSSIKIIPGAGHLVDLDQPKALADAILAFNG